MRPDACRALAPKGLLPDNSTMPDRPSDSHSLHKALLLLVRVSLRQ